MQNKTDMRWNFIQSITNIMDMYFILAKLYKSQFIKQCAIKLNKPPARGNRQNQLSLFYFYAADRRNGQLYARPG